MEVLPVKKITFVLSYDPHGQSRELTLAETGTRTIFVKPGDSVIVATTHPDGEQSITEFFRNRFYAWNYVPKFAQETNEKD